jgi:glycerol transport system ATP-binding protein
VQLNAGPALSIRLPDILAQQAATALTVGVRASALRLQESAGDVPLAGRVELAEISGSDTFVHLSTAVGEVVAQLTGVHRFKLGTSLTLQLNPAHVYVFDAQGALLVSPQGRGGH